MKTVVMNVSHSEYAFIQDLYNRCEYYGRFNEAEWIRLMGIHFGCKPFTRYDVRIRKYGPNDTIFGMPVCERFEARSHTPPQTKDER